MWLFELFGLTVVVGTVLGLVWRITENYFEKRAARKLSEAELVGEAPEIMVTAVTTTPISAVAKPVSKSN